MPPHEVDLDGSMGSEVYLPRFRLPESLNAKAAHTIGTSVVESLYCYGGEWDRWTETHGKLYWWLRHWSS